MDEVKPTATQCYQNGSAVVRSATSTATTTNRATLHWLRHIAACTTCTQPRHLHWQRINHEHSRLRVALLLFDRYAAFSVLSRGRFYCLLSRRSCCRAWIMEVRLWQAFPNTSWIVCTSHLPSSQVRPCVSIASGTALAFCS